MSVLLLSPHGDDETLFAAYTCIRERPHVIICSQDADPAVRRVRSAETTEAITALRCSHNEWPMPANQMDWDKVRKWLEIWNSPAHATVPTKVYAPAVSVDGHEQHNAIGSIAQEVFGDRVVSYLTYGPRGYRQRDGQEVTPTPAEITSKLRALSCYASQIDNPSTRPWFFDLLDLREWLA